VPDVYSAVPGQDVISAVGSGPNGLWSTSHWCYDPRQPLGSRQANDAYADKADLASL
jgi:hypothetical protein